MFINSPCKCQIKSLRCVQVTPCYIFIHLISRMNSRYLRVQLVDTLICIYFHAGKKKKQRKSFIVYVKTNRACIHQVSRNLIRITYYYLLSAGDGPREGVTLLFFHTHTSKVEIMMTYCSLLTGAVYPPYSLGRYGRSDHGCNFRCNSGSKLVSPSD